MNVLITAAAVLAVVVLFVYVADLLDDEEHRDWFDDASSGGVA